MEGNVVYILQCADGSLYTGWTNDLSRRLAAHQAGKGAKYTKGRLPVSLVYVEKHPSKEEAMRREYAIKRLSRREKLALIYEKGNDHATTTF
ncbi:MAG: GIY-YIG nuclease family protein [Candidatus Pararuminococcus gallinarum]